MTLIPLELDQKQIAKRFRKADCFAFVDGDARSIVINEHKTSKSNEFFEYFKTLGVKKLYLKELGYKTFLRLEALGIEVYVLDGVEVLSEISAKNLKPLHASNAEAFCTLGHHVR